MGKMRQAVVLGLVASFVSAGCGTETGKKEQSNASNALPPLELVARVMQGDLNGKVGESGYSVSNTRAETATKFSFDPEVEYVSPADIANGISARLKLAGSYIYQDEAGGEWHDGLVPMRATKVNGVWRVEVVDIFEW